VFCPFCREDVATVGWPDEDHCSVRMNHISTCSMLDFWTAKFRAGVEDDLREKIRTLFALEKLADFKDA